jgi:TonB family protein
VYNTLNAPDDEKVDKMKKESTWLFVCCALLLANAVSGAPADTNDIMIEMPSDSTTADSLPPIEKMPEIVNFVKASYSPEVMKQGIQGTVLLELLISDSGKVDSAKVVTGLHPQLDKAALDASRAFRFTPAIAGGVPVPVLIQYEYRFSIEQETSTIEKYVNFEGVVLESGTRKPVSDAMVVVSFIDTQSVNLPIPFSMYLQKIGTIDGQSLEEQKLVAVTDSLGTFKFFSLPACSVNVSIIVPGYENVVSKEKLTTQEVTNVKYFTKRHSYSEYEIVVYGKAAEKEVSKRQLTVQEIKLIPGLGGDAVKVVQALPGVARPSFASGAIVVRGAPTWDSKFYLDGILIPALYHFGGLKSTYNSDALAKVDFMPGGWGSRYGGAVAGVIELTGRDAKTDRWHGMLDLGVIDGSFLVEGPINDKVSVLLSARRSFVGDIVNWYTKNNPDVVPMNVASFYWDYILRTDLNLTKNNKLFLTMFGSSDSMTIIVPKMRYGSDEVSDKTKNFGINTTFHTGILGWDARIGDKWSNMMRLSVGGGRDDYSPFGFMKVHDNYTSLCMREQLTFKQSEKLNYSAGVDITLLPYDLELKIPDARNVLQSSNDENVWYGVIGGYANLEWKITNKLLVIPGLRFDYYPELKYDGSVIPEFWNYQDYQDLKGISGEPSLRLTTKYEINKKHLLKASVGNYSQTPQPMGQVTHKVWGDPNMPTTKASQYVLGHEWQITDIINSDLQLYWNNQWDLPDYSTNSDASSGDGANSLWNSNGKGRMYGLELMLRHNKNEHFFGWIAYTLSRTERYNNVRKKWELYDKDQTHNLQVLGSWHFKKEWDVGFRARYVSGNPTTPQIGRKYHEEYRSYEAVYGDKNSDRLDPFFQVDVRVDKKFVMDKWMLTMYVDLQNLSYFVYKSPEFEFEDDFYKEKQTVSSIMIPGFGCKVEF